MYASHWDEPMFVYGPPLYGASSWPELVQESTITQLRSWLAGRGIHARRGGKTELVRLVLLESERTPHSAADFQLQPWRSARQEVERRDHGRDARRSDAAIVQRAAVQQQRTILDILGPAAANRPRRGGGQQQPVPKATAKPKISRGTRCPGGKHPTPWVDEMICRHPAEWRWWGANQHAVWEKCLACGKRLQISYKHPPAGRASDQHPIGAVGAYVSPQPLPERRRHQLAWF